ncbi:MAG: T9SS type A sorting domain-containing protein [Bacteroidota bacterium]
MKHAIFTLLLLLCLNSVQGTTWTITNVANTFSPATLTIQFGDSVIFSISSSHDALEISNETWNTNGTTPISGGFEVPFGGGILAPSDLGVGTHYYICTAHAAMEMKGIIIVESATGIEPMVPLPYFILYPNPCTNFITIDYGSENCHYLIINFMGQPVKSALLTKGVNLIELSNLPSGFYFVSVIERPSYRYTLVKH